MSAGPKPNTSMKAMLQKMGQRAFRSVGYHLGKFPPRDSLDYLLQELLRHFEINCVIDVGAHDGEYAHSLRDIGYKGRIVSFEPVKATFQRLSAGFAGDPNWKGFNFALGAKDAELTMNLHQDSQFNSFLPVSSYGNERFSQYLGTEKEVVPIRRLDDLFAECVSGLPNPSVYLKIDTQGFDMEVIEGAKASMAQVKGLQSELSVKPVYEGSPDFTTSLTRLTGLGFEPAGMFSINRDSNGLSVVEFDCVMVRPRTPAA
jgi:FkbM family methyltransferase